MMFQSVKIQRTTYFLTLKTYKVCTKQNITNFIATYYNLKHNLQIHQYNVIMTLKDE